MEAWTGTAALLEAVRQTGECTRHSGVAVAGPIIGRTLSLLLEPIGWVLTSLWLIYDIRNTNWRKTIRAVVAIALLRLRLRWKESQDPLPV